VSPLNRLSSRDHPGVGRISSRDDIGNIISYDSFVAAGLMLPASSSSSSSISSSSTSSSVSSSSSSSTSISSTSSSSSSISSRSSSVSSSSLSSSSLSSDSSISSSSSSVSSSSSSRSSIPSSSSSSDYPAYIIESMLPYLQGYWAMDEATGFTRVDTSPSISTGPVTPTQNDLTPINGVTGTAGKHNNAAGFLSASNQYLENSSTSDL